MVKEVREEEVKEVDEENDIGIAENLSDELSNDFDVLNLKDPEGIPHGVFHAKAVEIL
jgi:hypothetical protein